MGKLFNSILNNRLQEYLKHHNIISNLQIGFEEGCRTADHLFTLKTAIDKYSTKSKLYTCFIDYKQAFDKIWHSGLLYKLTQIGINNYFFNLLRNMYSKLKVSVKIGNGQRTSHLPSEIGVRQGDNLSPTLFKIYINDLVQYISKAPNTDPVTIGSQKLNSLLYADDIVLISTSQKGLQSCINAVKQFSDTWKLDLNLNKTKVVIFNKRGKLFQETFSYGSEKIECVQSYTYLGIHLHCSGSFSNALDHLFNKGLKALHKLTKLLDHNYDIGTTLHIFDHTIKPILLYGSEVWGVDLLKPTSKKHLLDYIEDNKLSTLELKFYRRLLGVKRSTPISGIRGELGRHPIALNAITQAIKYFNHIQSKDQKSIVNQALIESGKLQNSWLAKQQTIKSQLNLTPNQPGTRNRQPRKKEAPLIERSLKTQYQQHWRNAIERETSKAGNKGGNKLRTYRQIKQNFHIEPYLTSVDNTIERKTLTQFRLSSHPLNIEAQRGTIDDPNKRLCQICDLNKTETEMHLLLECPAYSEPRQTFLKSITNKHLDSLTCENKYLWIMTNEDKNTCKLLSKFIYSCLGIRKSLTSTQPKV